MLFWGSKGNERKVNLTDLSIIICSLYGVLYILFITFTSIFFSVKNNTDLCHKEYMTPVQMIICMTPFLNYCEKSNPINIFRKLSAYYKMRN